MYFGFLHLTLHGFILFLPLTSDQQCISAALWGQKEDKNGLLGACALQVWRKQKKLLRQSRGFFLGQKEVLLSFKNAYIELFGDHF